MRWFIATAIAAALGGCTTYEPTVDENGDPDGATPRQMVDRDDDGREDGYDDPVVHVQDGVVEDLSGPYLLVHRSILASAGSQYCLSGYGFGTNEGWTNCGIMGTWSDDGQWLMIPVTDGLYRVNVKLNSNLCDELSDPDFDTYYCWANLDNEARSDELYTLNEDGTGALAMWVDDNFIYTGFDDGTGEEL